MVGAVVRRGHAGDGGVCPPIPNPCPNAAGQIAAQSFSRAGARLPRPSCWPGAMAGIHVRGEDRRARVHGAAAAARLAARSPGRCQSEALAASRAGGGRGVGVLPTGAGKSHPRDSCDRRPAPEHAGVLPDASTWWRPDGTDLLRTSFRDRGRLSSAAARYDLKPPHGPRPTILAYLHMQYFGGALRPRPPSDECHRHFRARATQLSAGIL
jgi:hypothetical protein